MTLISLFLLALTSDLWAGGAPPGAGGGWYREVRRAPYEQWVRVDTDSLKLVGGVTLTLETYATGLGAIGYPAILKSNLTSSTEELAILIAKANAQRGGLTARVTRDYYEFLRFPPYSNECLRNVAHDVAVSFEGHTFTLPTQWIVIESMTRDACDRLAKSVAGFRYI